MIPGRILGAVLLSMSALPALPKPSTSATITAELADERATLNQPFSAEPLASLSLHLQFDSSNEALWQVMAQGQQQKSKSAMARAAGAAAPPPPIEEYDAAVLPLVSFLPRIGG